MLVFATIAMFFFLYSPQLRLRHAIHLLLPLLLIFRYAVLQISPKPTSSEEV